MFWEIIRKKRYLYIVLSDLIYKRDEFNGDGRSSGSHKNLTSQPNAKKSAAASSVIEGNQEESVSRNVNPGANLYKENILKEYEVLVNASKAYKKDKLVTKMKHSFMKK